MQKGKDNLMEEKNETLETTENSADIPVAEETGKQKKLLKHVSVIAIECILLILAVAFLYVVTITTSTVKKTDVSTDNIEVNEEAVQKMEQQQKDKEESAGGKSKGYRNVVLFGVDSREGALEAGSRSDSIIIASLDQDTNEVQLISVYRDTYMNTGSRYEKCNAAYARGGPEQAMTMLNKSLDLNITDYVTVGFEGLIEAIDALGGVEVDVDVHEICHINNYQLCMAEELGCDYEEVYESGLQTLNGMQATAYCRIRYTKGDDFKRSERQRNVLEAMMVKAQSASLTKLSNAVLAIMPNVSTSLDVSEILSMLGSAATMKVTDSEGFPFEENRKLATVGKTGACIVPYSLEENVQILHNIFYDDPDYEVSSEVKEFSAQIAEQTAQYITY